MTYDNITRAVFVDRPDRFVAHVEIDGVIETVHVKNTGRCKELLLPGAVVWVTASNNPSRKTRYDLVAVQKSSGLLINIDSQAPNKAVSEWLATQAFDRIIPEYTCGASRIDFYLERGCRKYLMEVKGCTLEIGGTGYFPDAPTERGVKHIRELIKAKETGYHAILAFVIQMDGVTEVQPNVQTQPEFGAAMNEAKAAGVQIVFLPCHVEPDRLEILPDGFTHTGSFALNAGTAGAREVLGVDASESVIEQVRKNAVEAPEEVIDHFHSDFRIVGGLFRLQQEEAGKDGSFD